MNRSELAHLVNLITVASIDGKITEDEKNNIYAIAQSLGATDEEFEYCVKTADETKAKGTTIIEIPDTDEEKTSYLKSLTLMMMVDGEISEYEKDYIKFIAEKFGYDGGKALPILIESVQNDIRNYLGKKQGNSSDTTRESSGPADTRETGKTDKGFDEEQLKAEVREAVQLGKEDLLRHDIPAAFDHLIYAAHMDRNACQLFLMIINVRVRLFRLGKEQVALLKSLAEKGFALSQYAYGRWLESRRPESDSLDMADEYLTKAEKAGIGDALYAQAVLLKAGHYGLVDREKFSEMISQAVDQGSFLAEQYLYRQTIYGWNGVTADPQRIVDGLKKWLNGDESNDILVVNPAYYHVLGDAYAELNDKENAEHYYRKAINMGLFEAWTDLSNLHFNDEDFDKLLDQGCKAGVANCLAVRAARRMDTYNELEKEYQDELENNPLLAKGTKNQLVRITGDIMEDLLSAYEEGSDMAPYYLGDAYQNGSYGFDKDFIKAWNWYVEGANRDDGDAYLSLSLMISNHENPIEIPDEEKTMYYYVMMALRNNATADILDTVVEGYLNGEFSDYAEEFERYYLPEYYRKHEGEEEVDEDGDDEYKLIAIIEPNGNAVIHEFNVEEDWDDLPPMIDAKRLDAIRTQPLYDLTDKMGYRNKHITAWVDNMGLLRGLPENRIGCRLYPGSIVGDLILTLEDNKYKPMSFENLSELKQVIAELGATLKYVYLDDEPDDDGRFDAWS